MGRSDVLEEPGSRTVRPRKCFPIGGRRFATISRSAFWSKEAREPPTPSAPSRVLDQSALRIEEFEKEMEACFQGLSILKLGSWGADGKSFLIGRRKPGLCSEMVACQGVVHPQQTLTHLFG